MMVNDTSKEALAALAEDAEARDSLAEAVESWRLAVNAGPGNPAYRLRFISALDKSGCHAEAESAAIEAGGKFPGNITIALELGWIAARRRDWTLALQRWTEVEVKFPEHPAVPNAMGIALLHLERRKEAEQIFTAAYHRFDDNFALALAYATFPAKEGHWADAIERLEIIIERFPEQPACFAQLGEMLRLAGRRDDAQRILSNAAEKFPGASSIVIELIKLLEPDWAGATEKWLQAIATYPDNAAAYAGLGGALRRAGDHAKAEEILGVARKRFPGQVHIASEYAGLAADICDWDEAIRRWQIVVERFPWSENARESLAGARWSASFSNVLDPPSAETQDAEARQNLKSDPARGEVTGQFESLGENCEFGLVQRYYGLEPLGLLRFSSVHQNSLIALLNTRLDGVGDPENVRLRENANEYLTSDRRYGMVSHTFVAPHSVEQATFLKEQCKRIAFLKRKLLGDLERAEKIFVVTAHGDASDADALAIYAALRDYGANQLLYVRAGVPDVKSGSVRQIEDGLAVGYLDRWGGNPLTRRWNISHELWLTICLRTVAQLS